jgi:hypothetical protein
MDSVDTARYEHDKLLSLLQNTSTQALLTLSNPTLAEWKVSNGGFVPKPVPFSNTAMQSSDLHVEVFLCAISTTSIDEFRTCISCGASWGKIATEAAC